MQSKNIHKIKLSNLFWDYHFREEELQALLNGDVERVGHVDRYGLYARILTSMGWYQVIDLIPAHKLEEALSERVITKIRFKDIRDKYYFAKRLLRKKDVNLKIDFVNDVAFHYGGYKKFPSFPRVDNWRNILSNKLTALERREPKDVADILFIARNYSFHWNDIFNDGLQKVAYLDALDISKILAEFPVEYLSNIIWEKEPDLTSAAKDIVQIAKDILRKGYNSLQ